jgi:hypothetical protein
MVAFSFKRRFVNPIRVGLGMEPLHAPEPVPPKRQTVRGRGKKRPPGQGETLQLYYGMRTRQCFKIGDARCTDVKPIVLEFYRVAERRDVWMTLDGARLNLVERVAFAHDDGFDSLDDFVSFWHAEHGAPERWEGNVIYWEPLT